MKFPALPFLKKKSDREYFVALLFKPKSITSILLQNFQGNVVIISTKSVSCDLEKASTESIITAADEAISATELSLPDDQKLEKTIFSVPYSWSDSEGGIAKERLLQLKKISIELALKPMGFIITIEAVINFLQEKEGVPISAIFVEESNSRVYLYLVKGGSILEVHSSEVEDTIEKAVEHTLKKVEKFDKLPTKMVLLYDEEIESRQQKFLSYPWTQVLPFLHLPQVSFLEKGFENEAVVDGIASQLNSKVADMGGIAGVEVMEGDGSKVVEKDTLGFVKEKDVAHEDVGEEKDSEVGVIDADTADDIEDEREEKQDDKKDMFGIAAILSSVFAIPRNALDTIKSGTTLPSRIRMFLIPILAIFFFIILMVGYYVFFLKAEVVVFTEGEVLEDSVKVVLSSEDATSYDDKILHIDTLEETIEGEVSKKTTGVEETGEEAKGEVTIFNESDDELSLKSGQTITSSNDLEFVLDSDISIASKSAFSTNIPSKKVKVTAGEIGKEYNLPSNTNFTIEGFDASDAFAKNEVAFSGGTKEEKQIVARKDISGLEDALVDELREKALEQARGKVSSDETVISVVLDSSISDEEYSAEAGDEASEITLSGAITYTLGVYKTQEARKFIDEARGDSVPDEFAFSTDDSEIELSNVEEGEDEISAELNYRVLFKPEVETEKIVEDIKGKSIGSAEGELKKIKGVTDVVINFPNKLPLLPSFLPVRPEQIDISFKAEEV